jgi:LytS/YehU family sensor histidine kinase
VYSFFYFTIRTKPQPLFFEMLVCDALTGLAVTHLLRTLIRALGLLRLSLSKQIFYLFSTALVFAFVYAFVSIRLEELMGFETDTGKTNSTATKVIRATSGTFLFLLIWNLIYFTYHYIVKNRAEKLDKIRLESLVKELQLKTIKAHINPHFIFNALNSIRALVDENPQRARTAITELSNLLRSSMQAEKQETTPLERELNIVKDYLALEHIRFEDRLRVEYDIDEDTLDQPVPPMMLQTLVENAIKHGISKQVDGGLIRIISDFRGDHHELIVQNTGKLNGQGNSEGFGLTSTNNRLKILFGSKAAFEIKDTNANTVEAKVIMPVHNI